MSSTEYLIAFALVLVIVCAVIAFARTPSSERWSIQTKLDPSKTYAPMYSKEERVWTVLRTILWMVPVYLLYEFWALPVMESFDRDRYCLFMPAITELHIAMYVTIAGIPLAMAIIIAFTSFTESLAAWKAEQFPPPGEKVWSTTAYRYGFSAKATATIAPAIFVVMIVLTCYSIFLVDKSLSSMLDCG